MEEIIIFVFKIIFGLGAVTAIFFLVYGLVRYFLSRGEKYFRMFVLSLVSLLILFAIYSVLVTCNDCNWPKSNAII